MIVKLVHCNIRTNSKKKSCFFFVCVSSNSWSFVRWTERIRNAANLFVCLHGVVVSFSLKMFAYTLDKWVDLWY